MKISQLILVFACSITLSVGAQEVIPLYTESVPNSKVIPADVKESFGGGMYRNVTNPTLEVYLP